MVMLKNEDVKSNILNLGKHMDKPSLKDKNEYPNDEVFLFIFDFKHLKLSDYADMLLDFAKSSFFVPHAERTYQ